MINLDATLLIQAINFAILLFLLNKIAFKPLLSKLAERSNAIKSSLEEARQAREEAQRMMSDHQAKIRQVHQEAAAIRDQAMRVAAEEQQRLLEAARAEAGRIVEQARSQIDTDVKRARAALRQEVGALAIEVAEHLLRKSLREEDHRRLVADSINRLEHLS